MAPKNGGSVRLFQAALRSAEYLVNVPPLDLYFVTTTLNAISAAAFGQRSLANNPDGQHRGAIGVLSAPV